MATSLKHTVKTFFRRPAAPAPTASTIVPTLVGQPAFGLTAPDLGFTVVDAEAEMAWVEQTLLAAPGMFDEGTPDVLDGKLVERHRERVHRITEESRVITRRITAYLRDLDQAETELRPHLLAARAEYAQLDAARHAWDAVLAGTAESYEHPQATDGTAALPMPQVGERQALPLLPSFADARESTVSGDTAGAAGAGFEPAAGVAAADVPMPRIARIAPPTPSKPSELHTVTAPRTTEQHQRAS
ncbi:MAG TPA: hypothetical protein PKA99_04975 [Dermatophilaceae bacterium]|nr:hypothetical protein [Dermatophilaceae bacterium]